MPSLDLQIGAGADDVSHRRSDHLLPTTDIQLRVGSISGAFWDSAFRFTGVTIPQGATIDVAYLTLNAGVARSSTTVNSDLQAHDADASGQIANDTDWHNVVDANLTAALVTWDDIAAWAIDDDINSPSIVSVIQELVDRSGWNEIAHIFWLDGGSSSGTILRQARSYENDPAKAPKLHIEYTTADHIRRRRCGFFSG